MYVVYMSQSEIDYVENMIPKSHENILFIEGYLSEEELNVLKESIYAYSKDKKELDINNKSAILGAFLDRFLKCSHNTNVSENKCKLYHYRLPMTDLEFDLLNLATQKVNPKSSRSTITTIQNSVESIDENVYYIDMNIPTDLKNNMENVNNKSLDILTQNSDLVINSIDDEEKYRICTFITESERNELKSLSHHDVPKSVSEYSTVINSITMKFDIKNQRKSFIE